MLIFFLIQICFLFGTAADSNGDLLRAACNNKPLFPRHMILPTAPIADENITYSSKYLIPNLSSSGNNVTLYRFVNPGGVEFDGVCTAPSLLTLSLLLPGPAVAEASFFEGYAWRNLIVPSCATGNEGSDEAIGNPHLGWAFYEIQGDGVRDVPTFAFLVVESAFQVDSGGSTASGASARVDLRFGYAPAGYQTKALKRNNSSGPVSTRGIVQSW
jgi:hypothetical protein